MILKKFIQIKQNNMLWILVYYMHVSRHLTRLDELVDPDIDVRPKRKALKCLLKQMKQECQLHLSTKFVFHDYMKLYAGLKFQAKESR